MTSNCNTQTQFQDKNGKCLDLCVANNVPGVSRDGKCRKFSNTMLGKGQGQNGRDTEQAGENPNKPIKPPTKKPGGSNNNCPPGQKPSLTNSKVCVIDLEYNQNGNITCPPGQVFDNGTCKIPQQGPPIGQKPVSFVPDIPQSGCQPGQTCNSSINYQGNNVNAYTYNGNTYVIKNVNGKPQPCIYKPDMNSGGSFPCLDDYTVNFVNGQIVPNNGFENAFGR